MWKLAAYCDYIRHLCCAGCSELTPWCGCSLDLAFQGDTFSVKLPENGAEYFSITVFIGKFYALRRALIR